MPDVRLGLSAAGYLDPAVFRSFHRAGVELCSGYGMTEATGGITMTAPGGYVDGSIGQPLPGIECRRAEDGSGLRSSRAPAAPRRRHGGRRGAATPIGQRSIAAKNRGSSEATARSSQGRNAARSGYGPSNR